MRLIEVFDCSYADFNSIRRKVLLESQGKFGLLSTDYISELSYARYWFNDLFYIPGWLMPSVSKYKTSINGDPFISLIANPSDWEPADT